MNLRQITEKDQLLLKKVYFDSIQSIDEKIYTKDQKRSWSEQAWNNPNFDNAISKGRGWLIHKNEKIIAFALRYPESRVSLLYCRGEYQRKGLGTKLLSKLEEEAKIEGLNFLTTEASLISYGLFMKKKWKVVRKEKIIINESFFERYKMKKIF